MLLMALDRAVSFAAGHHSAETWGMPAPSDSSGLGFATRLASHLCTPGFAFLMGMGMPLLAASRRAQGWSEVRTTPEASPDKKLKPQWLRSTCRRKPALAI